MNLRNTLGLGLAKPWTRVQEWRRSTLLWALRGWGVLVSQLMLLCYKIYNSKHISLKEVITGVCMSVYSSECACV